RVTTVHRAARAAALAARRCRHQASLLAGMVVAGVRVRSRTNRGRVLLGVMAVLLVGLPTAAGFGVAVLVGVGDGGRPAPTERIAKIGLVVPLSGDLAEVGGAVRNAVQLAVEEANEAAAVPGWKLELVVYDDLSRPDGGAAAAVALAEDDAVVGVVGPLSSTVATVAVPTLDEAGIAVVSPSNTRAALTGHGDEPRDRPF
nr:ABC transporter substrate-binding protein [Micromonospora sp. DSM 115978]